MAHAGHQVDPDVDPELAAALLQPLHHVEQRPAEDVLHDDEDFTPSCSRQLVNLHDVRVNQVRDETRLVVVDREGRSIFETPGMMADWMPPW